MVLNRVCWCLVKWRSYVVTATGIFKNETFWQNLTVTDNNCSSAVVTPLIGKFSRVCIFSSYTVFAFYVICFRRAILSYGLFDQLRVDNGREFYLSLAIQEQMSDMRQNQAIRCYQHTESKRVGFKHS